MYVGSATCNHLFFLSAQRCQEGVLGKRSGDYCSTVIFIHSFVMATPDSMYFSILRFYTNIFNLIVIRSCVRCETYLGYITTSSIFYISLLRGVIKYLANSIQQILYGYRIADEISEKCTGSIGKVSF